MEINVNVHSNLKRSAERTELIRTTRSDPIRGSFSGVGFRLKSTATEQCHVELSLQDKGSYKKKNCQT